MKPPIEYRPKPKRLMVSPKGGPKPQIVQWSEVQDPTSWEPKRLPEEIEAGADAILKHIRALNRKRAKAFRARKKAKK